jgi:hypothetical protein
VQPTYDGCRLPESDDHDRGKAMGALQPTMNVSLDTRCEHMPVLTDEEYHTWVSDSFNGAAPVLCGRNTFLARIRATSAACE